MSWDLRREFHGPDSEHETQENVITEVSKEQVPDVVVQEAEERKAVDMKGNNSNDFISVQESASSMHLPLKEDDYDLLVKDEDSDDFVSVQGEMGMAERSDSSVVEVKPSSSNTSLQIGREPTPKKVKRTVSSMGAQTDVDQKVEKKISNMLVQTDIPKEVEKTHSNTSVQTDIILPETVTKNSVPFNNFDTLKRGGATITKRDRFLTEAMSDGSKRDKSVEEIPGIGKEYGGRLKDGGMQSAKNLYGHFLINPNGFKEFLMTFGVDILNAGEAYSALKTWDNNHN